MRTLGEWMDPDPATVEASASLEACARRLVDRRADHLLVTDARGRLTGLLESAAVFARGRLEGDRFVPHRPAGAAPLARDLARPATLAGPDLPATEALRLLLASPEAAVAVVDDQGAPLGLFAEQDAVARAAELLPRGPTAGALMTPAPYSVRSSDPLHAAWVILQFHGFRHLLVIDDGRLVGVLSRRDLLEADAEHDPWTTVDDRMEPPLETVGTDAELAEVADRMARQRVGCVPVLEDRRVVGLLTRTDLIQALLDHLPPRSRSTARRG